jgi:hypothetical protein
MVTKRPNYLTLFSVLAFPPHWGRFPCAMCANARRMPVTTNILAFDESAACVGVSKATLPKISNRESGGMRNAWIMILTVLVGWAGPVTLAGAGLFSAKGAVIAILGGELFVGEAEGHLNGAGTLAIHSQKFPERKCTGEFTSSAELGGKGQLTCSDGTTATFQFRRLSVFRGHGTGSHSRGAMSFTYGIAAEEAAPYLKLPDGKKLARTGTELALNDL